MKPVFAIVGRPNVGKSTLFNCLTQSRDALVADFPGLTRDRKYGDGRLGGNAYIVVDTGGLTGEADTLDGLLARQAQQAIDESDALLFMVDGRAGLTAGDETIAAHLRNTGKPVYLIVNKTDGLAESTAVSEFFRLGLGEPIPIAASHGRNVTQMIARVLAEHPGDDVDEAEAAHGIRIALVGRPNVGKSTLVNRLVGEERVVAFDRPGTTRDTIYVPFERDGKAYTLIDTAGIRRRGRISETVEKFSVIKALQAIMEAQVVFVLIDAREGLTDQDLNLLGDAVQHGKALVVAINKWDGLTPEQRDKVKADIERRLDFLDYAEKHFISALHGTGVGLLFEATQRAYDSATRSLPTPRLTQLLEEAVVMHQPPLVRGRRIKLRYAHQGGKNPPVIVVHGNQLDRLPEDYKRYLTHFFRKRLKLYGTPVQIQLKSGKNPYEGRRNKLTPHQEYKRKRLMRHVKK
ncbi:MAG TPA: ribosome biogenesis GTPase Der [Gammaproteobacteria bacterium]